MQKADVLKPIKTSPWVSNMVLVQKSNGTVRICCDYSDLCKAIIPDRYPLPKIDDLSKLSDGARYLSKIDLNLNYN